MPVPTKICLYCKMPGEHTDSVQCLQATQSTVMNLVKSVGKPGTCRGCRKDIYWITHSNGRHVPYDPLGLNHFISCSEAAQFKTARPG